jgi:hypothetical protein
METIGSMRFEPCRRLSCVQSRGVVRPYHPPELTTTPTAYLQPFHKDATIATWELKSNSGEVLAELTLGARG